MLQYQREPIVPGKFYVSDTGPIRKGGFDFTRERTFGRNDTRCGGPCDTREEAAIVRQTLIDGDTNLGGTRLYVWEAHDDKQRRDRKSIEIRDSDLGGFYIQEMKDTINEIEALCGDYRMFRQETGVFIGDEQVIELAFPNEDDRPQVEAVLAAYKAAKV